MRPLLSDSVQRRRNSLYSNPDSNHLSKGHSTQLMLYLFAYLCMYRLQRYHFLPVFVPTLKLDKQSLCLAK